MVFSDFFMSQPTEYQRQYSFTAFQGSNPDDPLPAVKVELEFNAIKTTLDQIRANLALIQRDDGELANSSVGTAQLEATLTTLGFDRPTSWLTATAYAVDAAVFESNKLYFCETAHTSGTFATDLAAGKWVEVVDFTSIVVDAEAAADAAAVSAAAASASAASAAAVVAAALPLTGGAMLGYLATLASEAGGAGFRLPHGVAPSAPVNGDVWSTTAALFYRINGATKTSMDLESEQTLTAKKTLPASTTSGASINMPHGTAPSAPVNGDLWSTTTTLNVRLNGTTKAVSLVGNTLAADHIGGNWKVFYTNGSGVITELAVGASGTVLTSAGASNAPTFSAPATSGITLVAEQASTSGTAITFGSIPAGVKRITVMLDNVSFTTNGVTVLLQIGDAGGIETSSYEQGASKVTSAPATTFIASTSGFALAVTGSNNDSTISGQCILNRQDASHTWTASWAICGSAVGTAHICVGGGMKQLSAELTQLGINGATFDAGSISISYE